MGVLDSAFSGDKGLVNVLSRAFGGTATITYQTNGQTYNEVTDTYTGGTSSSVNVSAIPAERTLFLTESGGGILLDSSDIILTVPASQLNTVPQSQRDTITYNGIRYNITRVQTTHVGDAVTSYIISGKR